MIDAAERAAHAGLATRSSSRITSGARAIAERSLQGTRKPCPINPGNHLFDFTSVALGADLDRQCRIWPCCCPSGRERGVSARRRHLRATTMASSRYPVAMRFCSGRAQRRRKRGQNKANAASTAAAAALRRAAMRAMHTEQARGSDRTSSSILPGTDQNPSLLPGIDQPIRLVGDFAGPA